MMMFGLFKRMMRRQPLQHESDDVTINEMHFTREGGLEFRAEHPAFAALVVEIGHFFKKFGGENYVEFCVWNKDFGEMVVTVRPINGETPAQKADRFEAEIRGFKAKLAVCETLEKDCDAPLTWVVQGEDGNLLWREPYALCRLFAEGQDFVWNSVRYEVLSCVKVDNEVHMTVKRWPEDNDEE